MKKIEINHVLFSNESRNVSTMREGGREGGGVDLQHQARIGRPHGSIWSHFGGGGLSGWGGVRKFAVRREGAACVKEGI